ncbi:PadR family transcriptional regulator [Solihabitans fulvus]|uniref:PadR family transcriptional regulator n=2 Tax=Solihabitans fulvus TaxID=1892852 RepID=A0A5B2WIN3_9PSEU|nr:PadR family transcriptional regulator [Solihabitans fulvus]
MHPYEMQQTMRERHVNRMVKVTVGSLYHAVDKLERTGLIEATQTSREGNRPERTTYRITDEGRDVFADQLRHMTAEPADEYPEFDLAVGFLHKLDPEDALRQLHERTTAIESNLAAQQVWMDRLATQNLQPMYWINIRYRHAMWQAELTWIRDLVARLESGQINWPNCTPRTKLTVVHESAEETG